MVKPSPSDLGTSKTVYLNDFLNSRKSVGALKKTCVNVDKPEDRQYLPRLNFESNLRHRLFSAMKPSLQTQTLLPSQYEFLVRQVPSV